MHFLSKVFRIIGFSHLIVLIFIFASACLQPRSWNAGDYPSQLQLEIAAMVQGMALLADSKYLRLAVYSLVTEDDNGLEWFHVTTISSEQGLTENLWLPVSGSKRLVVDLLDGQAMVLGRFETTLLLQAGAPQVILLQGKDFDDVPLDQRIVNVDAFFLVIGNSSGKNSVLAMDRDIFLAAEAKLTYWDISHLFERYNCVVCHRNANILDLREMPFASSQLANMSEILSRMQNVIEAQLMPPDPLPKFSREDIELFQKWVDQGAVTKPSLPPHQQPGSSDLKDRLQMSLSILLPKFPISLQYEIFYDQRERYFVSSLNALPKHAMVQLQLTVRSIPSGQETTVDLGRRYIGSDGYWTFAFDEPGWQHLDGRGGE